MLAIIGVYLLLTLPYLNFIPFWDGGVYIQCVTDILKKPFAVANLHCFNHPALTHIGLVALTQKLSPGNLALLFSVNIALGIWAGIAFARIIRTLIDRRDPWLAPLGMALFLFLPVSVAHLFHINPDTPLLLTWITGFDFLTRRRFIGAGILFTLTAFSKETGILIVGATCALFAYFELCDVRKGWKGNLHILRMAEHALLMPILSLGTYLMIVHLTSKRSLFWSQGGITSTPKERWKLLFDFNTGKPDMKAFLFDIFFLNFQWLLTALVVAALAHWVLTAANRVRGSLPMRRVFFFVLLFLFTVYVVTRVRNWNNARYVLSASAMLIFCAVIAARRLFSPRTGAIVLGVIAGFFLASNLRTIDPLSRKMYGTLNFGEHSMLRRNSLYGGGFLRDTFVYNLEFTQLHYLTQDIFHDLQITPNIPLLVSRFAVFGLPGIDKETHTLTWNPKKMMGLHYYATGVIPEDHYKYFADARLGYYIEYPNLDNKSSLELAYKSYRFLWVRTYRRDGYAIRVHAFEVPHPVAAR